MNAHPQPLIDKVEALAGESVERTFKEMLGIHLHPGDPGTIPSDPEGQIVGSVGFVGDANGVVHLYASEQFARVITGRMLGLPENHIDRDDIVNDAMGELSNVIVGQVKSRLCDGGLSCTLTLPSIMRGGHRADDEPEDPGHRLIRFHDHQHRLVVELAIQDGQH